jgi:hypothetical protein
MRLHSAARMMTAGLIAVQAATAAAQIPQDQYLKYVPLSYPGLIRQTEATRQFSLYGDPADPAYRDVAPKDGVDDARAAWFEQLGVRFAPLMVRNSYSFPIDFRALAALHDLALHVDTWDLARSEGKLVGGSTLALANLTGQPCSSPESGTSEDCRLEALVRDFGPRRGPVEPEAAAHAERERFAVLYFDLPGYDERTWKQVYGPGPDRKTLPELARAARVYVHPFVAEAPRGASGARKYEFVLQYWFFYAINDGPNNHEGDWEHVNVIVSRLSAVERALDAGEIEALIAGRQGAEGEDPIVIRRIEYYTHHLVYPMDFSSPNAYQPREAWDKQVAARAKDHRGGRWMWDRIRERAWKDAAETRINTQPVIWIGGDAVGIQSVLQRPGLKDVDGHGSYPYRGRYKKIGPGVSERVLRAFDHVEYFKQPEAAPDYLEDYAKPEKVALLPDWERMTDLVYADSEVRRAWAWFVLPVRFGYPASPSPAAGTVSHMDMGNVSVVGPAFNGGWNRIGDSRGYDAYDIVKLSWASPLGLDDSFFARAGYLNAPILFFMAKPPLDLLWRTAALPVRAGTGSREPSLVPASAPAQRTVSLEAGIIVTPVAEDFAWLFLNREQLPELAQRLKDALPPGATNLDTTYQFPTVAAPIYSWGFHLGRRFTAESSFVAYSADVGFDVSGPGVPAAVPVRGRFRQYDYNGSLRFNLLTGSVMPYLKYGSGMTWYRLTDVSVDGTRMIASSSPTFKPGGNWYSLGFNELVLGGGVDVVRLKVGRVWIGGKAGYTAIHHALGFERDAAVELSRELAVALAGQTYSVWRQDVRMLVSIGF